MGVVLEFLSQLKSGDVSSISILIGLIFIPLSLIQLYHYLNPIKPLPSSKANNSNRKFGNWRPEDFKFPIPNPFPNWDLQTTKPVPYRAFRNKYNVTMGIRNMPYEDWIQLDNEWLKFHHLKQKRIQEKGDEIYGTLKEAYKPALELLQELRIYLSNRYPTLFEKTINGIKIIPTNEEFNTVNPSIDPMLIVAQLIQDDVAIMVEDSNGEYVLKGGCIILAGFWRLKDKINTTLSSIHTSGDVPKYNTHLKKGMEKFFIRLTPDKPVVRNNYFLQTDDNLDWSHSIGDENSDVVGWYTAPEATDIDQIWYRSERQSLRRLPITGAVIFTIRTYFLPLKNLGDEPFIPLRLLNGIESWDDDVKEYKGYDKFKGVVIPYLKEKAKEQEALGYTAEKDQSSYPF